MHIAAVTCLPRLALTCSWLGGGTGQRILHKRGRSQLDPSPPKFNCVLLKGSYQGGHVC